VAVEWQVPVLVRYHVTDQLGNVAGYGLRIAAPYGLDDDEVLRALDEEYRSADLAAMAEARLFCVPATPELLAGASDLLGGIAHPVVEVPPGLLTAPAVDQIMAEQRDQGVRFALGGFRATPEQVQALGTADLVMVDAEDPRLPGTLAECGSAQVVARGATSRAAAEQALAAGADLVETLWAYPDDDRAPGQLDAVEAQCLALLAALDRQPAEPDQVAEVISASPELSVAVLRQVNSSAVALRHRVDSVRHATVLAGPRRLRTVAVAALAGARNDGIDALWAVLARARAVEDLTGRETGYTAGLLSGLADVRRFPLDWLTTRAGVSPQIGAALLAQRGALGVAVAAVAAQEAGNPAEVAALGMDPWVVSRAWLTAVVETRALLSDLA
jgi:EAL and modified HD-GYP domain-containing signal transduction protein